jgi:uncharacterized Zn finger protein
MKVSSTIPDKAARFITEGRILEISGAVGVYCVMGDNGNYLVDLFTSTCTCPATVECCSHRLAVTHTVLNKES